MTSLSYFVQDFPGVGTENVMSWETPQSGQTRMVGYPRYRLPSIRISKKYSTVAKRVTSFL